MKNISQYNFSCQLIWKLKILIAGTNQYYFPRHLPELRSQVGIIIWSAYLGKRVSALKGII